MMNGAVWQGLQRQLAECRELVLPAGKSDWNELLCGPAKPGAGGGNYSGKPGCQPDVKIDFNT